MPKITTEITGLRENLGTLEEGRGFNPKAGPLLRVLKQLESEVTVFALRTAKPSCCSGEHVNWRAVPSPAGDVSLVSSISTLVLNNKVCYFHTRSGN